MWNAIRFERINESFPAVEAYVVELRAAYRRGRVEHLVFRCPEHPILATFLERDAAAMAGFFQRFWATPDVRESFVWDVYESDLEQWQTWTASSSFLIAGTLSHVLFEGGPYHEFKKSAVYAKDLGDAAAAQMIQEYYEETSFYYCTQAWSTFTVGPWNHSAIVINRAMELIHVLLATDTD